MLEKLTDAGIAMIKKAAKLVNQHPKVTTQQRRKVST